MGGFYGVLWVVSKVSDWLLRHYFAIAIGWLVGWFLGCC